MTIVERRSYHCSVCGHHQDLYPKCVICSVSMCPMCEAGIISFLSKDKMQLGDINDTFRVCAKDFYKIHETVKDAIREINPSFYEEKKQ